MLLGSHIRDFALNFPTLRKNKYHSSETTRIVTKDIPSLIQNSLQLSNTKYRVYGSCGSGSWNEVPWIALLNRSITESTQNGYYVVFLFSADLRSLYLGLAVGWTQFSENFGGQLAKFEIQKTADYLSKKLHIQPSGFKAGPIDLKARNILGKGYELGQVFSKVYDIEHLAEDDVILNDVRNILESYDELIGMVGSSVLNITIDDSHETAEEELFRTRLAKLTLTDDIEASLKTAVDEAALKPVEIKTKLIHMISRNATFASLIKKRATYHCEICGRDPFIQRNGKPYAEADHVIPLGNKGTDHPDNMRCLCPLCHRIITFGSKEELDKLFKE